MSFQDLFHSPDPARNQFLAAVLNLFSQEVVRCWVADAQSPFEDLGKASLRQARAGRGITLDFALRRRNRVYAVVMKGDMAETATLTDPAQIEAAKSAKSFSTFLDAAANPSRFKVVVRDEKLDLAGAILIWGAADPAAARAAKRQFSLYEVFSLEQLCADLARWNNHEYQMLLDRRVAWNHDLFKTLRRP